MADKNWFQGDFSRSQIQDLAKRNGIRANLKSADIIAELNNKGILPTVALTNQKEIGNAASTPETQAPPEKPVSRRIPRSEAKDGQDNEDIAAAENVQALMLDTLDAFDVEELDQRRLEAELARRGLSLEGDFEVRVLY